MSEFLPIGRIIPNYILFSKDKSTFEIDVANAPDGYLYAALYMLRKTDSAFTIKAYFPDGEKSIANSELKTPFTDDDFRLITKTAIDLTSAYIVAIEAINQPPQEMVPGMEYVPQSDS